MWLINARTMRLVHIDDETRTPRYAILSHTWLPEGSEVSFRDMTQLGSRLSLRPRRKPGWSKVANTCRLALSYKCEYAWIDTCCIDTSSSAELQEAINSMFRWYERAEVCFVHLADVQADDEHERDGSAFRTCRWFRRGWTLQELLAPATLVFYDKAWSVISDKDDADMRRLITEITGIDDYYICRSNRNLFSSSHQWLSRASVAERMSWAAGRETTRTEDLAYCLLGIFDINMPMLYGEGMKAFQRLQEEIMKVDDDCSLLCWGWNHGRNSGETQTLATAAAEDESLLLAPHPRYFEGCKRIRPQALPGFTLPLFSLSQRGLKVRAPVRDDVTHAHLSYVVLGCGLDEEEEEEEPEMDDIVDDDEKVYRTESSSRSLLAIPLVSNSACISRSRKGEIQEGEFYRPNWCRPIMVSAGFLKKAETKEILIRRAIREPITIVRSPVRLLFQESRMFKSADVIAVYPPQPIPGALATLGRRTIHGMAFSTKEDEVASPRKESRRSPQGVYEYHIRNRKMLEKQQSMGLDDVQVMIHIRIPSGGLILVTIELSESAHHRSFRCRMFLCARQLGFEDLHALSVSHDYTHNKQLQALGCDGTGGFFSFKMDDESGISLEAMYTSMSDVDRVIIGTGG